MAAQLRWSGARTGRMASLPVAPRSQGECPLGERSREPMPGIDVDRELVMAAVGGEHDGGLEVALADDLEQCCSGVSGQREVAQFVELCRCRHRPNYADTATMPTEYEGDRRITWSGEWTRVARSA